MISSLMGTSAVTDSRPRKVGLVLLALLAASCGGTEGGDETTRLEPADRCADVIEAVVTRDGSGTYRFDVTVSSQDTGWDKYADAWEVRDSSGNVLGVRVLTHPHVDEQPFTRSLSQVMIPTRVRELVVAARDSVDGFCGEELTLAVPLT
ncbi:MAG: hypothetical protein V3U39_00485 [Acidimicrobiia bacterium]